LVQPLQQASTFLSAGPVLIDSNSPVRIPRLAATSNVGFVAAGAVIPDSGIAPDEIDALPSSLESLKAWVPLSNELIRGSAVTGLSALLEARVVTDVANALDAALYTGSGASNTIKGLTNVSGIQTGTLDVTDLNTILDGVTLLQGANAQPNRLFLNPSDWNAFRKIQRGTTNKAYVLDPDAHAADTFALFGIPVTVTNRLAVGKAIIADMRYVVVVRDTAPSVFISNERLADQDSIAIRVTTRFDLAVTQPEAVLVLTAAA
jgi:HK97 family phage major capsid protein